MSEMITRVGRAIDAELTKAGITLPMQPVTAAMARAAIGAMREPTLGMCEAGQKVNNLCEEPGHFEFLSRDEIDGIWHAMVDEGLK